ncbi:MAG: hypothetical protein ACRDY7_09815 [Acidimicrobiia bacterium]
MTSPPSARWLALVVLALLGVSTSVAAIRNGEDRGGRASSELAASQQEREPAPDVTRTPAEVSGQVAAPQVSSTVLERPGRTGTVEAPAASLVPADEGTLPGLPEDPVEAPGGGYQPEPRGAASPASEEPTPAPSPPPAQASPAPPAPPAESTPAPESLLAGTATVRLGPVGLVVHLDAGDTLDADLTVGDDQVVGDAPPAEQTEVTVDGMLLPSTGVGLAPGPVLA